MDYAATSSPYPFKLFLFGHLDLTSFQLEAVYIVLELKAFSILMTIRRFVALLILKDRLCGYVGDAPQIVKGWTEFVLGDVVVVPQLKGLAT